jgi:glycosyltransferase involved in cell wall biosynthesis
MLERGERMKARRKLKVLFATVVSYVPAYEGVSKDVRDLAESFAAKGHDVKVLAFGNPMTRRQMSRRQFRAKLRALGCSIQASRMVDVYNLNGVEVHCLSALEDVLAYMEALGQQFQPDRIFVSLEDPSLHMLASAEELCPQGVIVLSLTTHSLPFGPDNAYPGVCQSDAPLRNATAIVANSEFGARYLRKYGKLSSTVLYTAAFGHPPFPKHGRYDNEFVTLINPCIQKGSPIFLDLAKQFPDVKFAGVLTWGASASVQAAMRQHPNITALSPVDDINEVFQRTRVSLVPSLMHDAFPKVVVEAMLRGIPVLAAKVGGIPETGLPPGLLLPVRPITGYTGKYDSERRPIPRVPPQNFAPWRRALLRLLSDPQEYRAAQKVVLRAGMAHYRRASADKFERLMLSL